MTSATYTTRQQLAALDAAIETTERELAALRAQRRAIAPKPKFSVDTSLYKSAHGWAPSMRSTADAWWVFEITNASDATVRNLGARGVDLVASNVWRVTFSLQRYSDAVAELRRCIVEANDHNAVVKLLP
jgi:hypothetical protein